MPLRQPSPRVHPPDYFGPLVKEPQETIQIHNPRAGSTAYSHPFKLSIVDDELLVGFGMVFIPRVYLDTDDKPFITLDAASVTVGSGGLNNDPVTPAGGTIALTPSTEYGVWFEFPWIGPDGNIDKTSGVLGGQWVSWLIATLGNPTVVVNTTHVNPSATSAIMAANSAKSYIYIGKIKDDGSILQYLRSDLVVPAVTLPDQIISSENVTLFVGTDGGIGAP